MFFVSYHSHLAKNSTILNYSLSFPSSSKANHSNDETNTRLFNLYHFLFLKCLTFFIIKGHCGIRWWKNLKKSAFYYNITVIVVTLCVSFALFFCVYCAIVWLRICIRKVSRSIARRLCSADDFVKITVFNFSSPKGSRPSRIQHIEQHQLRVCERALANAVSM